MGIEKLSAAAQAAGYAMATSEDLLTSAPQQPRPMTDISPWQSAEIRQDVITSNDSAAMILRRNIYALFGRRAAV